MVVTPPVAGHRIRLTGHDGGPSTAMRLGTSGGTWLEHQHHMSTRFIGVMGALATIRDDRDDHGSLKLDDLATPEDGVQNRDVRTALRVVSGIPCAACPE